MAEMILNSRFAVSIVLSSGITSLGMTSELRACVRLAARAVVVHPSRDVAPSFLLTFSSGASM